LILQESVITAGGPGENFFYLGLKISFNVFQSINQVKKKAFYLKKIQTG
jgi:hypothetical protein